MPGPYDDEEVPPGAEPGIDDDTPWDIYAAVCPFDGDGDGDADEDEVVGGELGQ